MKRLAACVLLAACGGAAQASVLRASDDVRAIYGSPRTLIMSVPVLPDDLLTFQGIKWVNNTNSVCFVSVYEGETLFRITCERMPDRYIDARKQPFGHPVDIDP